MRDLNALGISVSCKRGGATSTTIFQKKGQWLPAEAHPRIATQGRMGSEQGRQGGERRPVPGGRDAVKKELVT